MTLHTDGHRAYRQGLAKHPQRNRFRHLIFPNPPRPHKGAPRSPEARERDSAMFAVDLLHGLLRHSNAHHRRETIAFGRRLNALMERAFVTVVWRNMVKACSERTTERKKITPAMALGMTDAPWSWSKVLAQRLFPARLDLPPAWQTIYRRQITTAAVGRNTRHTLIHAF